MRLLSTRAGKIAVELSGEGPPVVLTHSVAHDHHDFDEVVAALSPRFQTVAVDWPGHGESEMPAPPSSASAGLLCDVLEDVVEALHLPPAILIGNSVGGTACLRLAARKPERVRALVLVDTSGLIAPSALLKALCWVQGREWIRRATGMAFARGYLKRRNDGTERLLGRLARSRQRPGFFAMDAAMWRSFATSQNDLRAEAAAIRCPTLIVWGKHDPVIRARVEGARARAVLPHARYVELDTGHVPFVEDPPVFLDAVLPFLKELPPG